MFTVNKNWKIYEITLMINIPDTHIAKCIYFTNIKIDHMSVSWVFCDIFMFKSQLLLRRTIIIVMTLLIRYK